MWKFLYLENILGKAPIIIFFYEFRKRDWLEIRFEVLRKSFKLFNFLPLIDLQYKVAHIVKKEIHWQLFWLVYRVNILPLLELINCTRKLLIRIIESFVESNDANLIHKHEGVLYS